MAPSEILRLSFPDLGSLEREIATNIRYGRLFIGDVLDVPVLSEGMLVLVHPIHGRELRLLAQIVMVNSEGPMRGTGFALRSFGPDEAERVLAFVHEHAADPARPLSLAPEPRARATVPPTSPENDWSDLPTTGLTRQPPPLAAARDELPAAVPADLEADSEPGPEPEPQPVAVIVPAAVVVPAEPPAQVEAVSDVLAPVAHEEDDWSDVESAVTGSVIAARTRLQAASAAAAVAGAAGAAPAIPQPSAADHENSLETPHATDEPSDEDAGETSESSDLEPTDELASDDGDAHFDEDASLEQAATSTELQSTNRQERLRSLNVVEQLKIARRGELSDRVVVERMYGKQVWEALLQNPRITLPEVARIARKGTVPRPLVEVIVGNATWTKAPNVRRALLQNPKLTSESVMKLLLLTPKHELKILEKATAYPMSVRDAARKLLRES